MKSISKHHTWFGTNNYHYYTVLQDRNGVVTWGLSTREGVLHGGAPAPDWFTAEKEARERFMRIVPTGAPLCYRTQKWEDPNESHGVGFYLTSDPRVEESVTWAAYDLLPGMQQTTQGNSQTWEEAIETARRVLAIMRKRFK